MRNQPIEAFVRLLTENQKENMIVAEIGVFQGDTTVHYLPIIKKNKGKCYLVDSFMIGNNFENFNKEEHDSQVNIVKTRIQQIECLDIVTLLDMDSKAAADLIPDESLDICFLDADHKYNGIMSDIKSYLPKVKKNGILCGHDCEGFDLVGTFKEEDLVCEWFLTPLYVNQGCHPGVIQAVYDCFGKVELMEDFGFHKIPVWVYRKNI